MTWFKAPDGVSSVSVEGQQFTPDEDGYFEAPEAFRRSIVNNPLYSAHGEHHPLKGPPVVQPTPEPTISEGPPVLDVSGRFGDKPVNLPDAPKAPVVGPAAEPDKAEPSTA